MENELSAHKASPGELDNTIAVIAHGLRTPLTGIKLHADILLSQEEDIHAASNTIALAIISAEAERMSCMIANIIDIQNIISGRIHWNDEETDLMRLTLKCARPFKRWCETKRIGFEYAGDVERLAGMIDADRFSRLVTILLLNALRFTSTGSIKLRLRKDYKKFRLEVGDTGAGISEERLKELLQSQAGSFGLGEDIGMTFACAVISHYRGRIWAESVVGAGSTFYVELPLNDAE